MWGIVPVTFCCAVVHHILIFSTFHSIFRIDQPGKIIQVISMGGFHQQGQIIHIQWAGVTTDGAPLPDGVYGFHVEYFQGDTPIGTQPAHGYARIEEVQSIDGETWLTMQGGVQIRSSLVAGVRDPV